MMFIAILLRAWIIEAKQKMVKPRTMADDLMVSSIGSRCLTTFVYAFQATMTHLAALGGRISAHKSYLFSTAKDFRSWLDAYIWPPVQEKIKVVSSVRDLGSMINTMVATRTGISQARLSKGIATLRRIGWAAPAFDTFKGHKGELIDLAATAPACCACTSRRLA